MKLFYREYGTAGRPLIILHGLLGSSDNWLPQASMLSDEYHVFVVDQRNHGQSPHSDDFSYDHLANDLRGLFRNTGLSSQLYWVIPWAGKR